MRFALFSSLVSMGVAIDNGKGLLPPMGWRSWNSFHGHINQDIMEAAITSMVDDSRGTSLRDLGYIDVGLDDAWQACGTGFNNSFHDAMGNPLVNETRFPSMSGWVQKAHDNNLTAGWYMNNCICRETMFSDPTYLTKHMERSVDALVEANFDSVKLDGCGVFMNLTWWSELINATGHPITTECCHGGRTFPGQTDGNAPCTGTSMPSNCPYNFFRSSHDIHPTWESIFSNLQSTTPFQDELQPLSRPGTWAYPDMLQVGNMPSFNEDRTHFGAWCIVSSPLTLGHNPLDKNVTDKIWPIISNTEAIAVNQAWFGHPGRLVRNETDDSGDVTIQHWTKKLHVSNKKAAVLLLNNASSSKAAVVDLGELGFPTDTPVSVRDIWEHTNLPDATGKISLGLLASHDSRFLLLELKD
eukprot:TRINITY_DN5122_c0_g1_i1.p1 TRINITY_DN5122_c0_g1~~TRINITY_DN5122_c0_g1_i1.p1  ORF type:complete len:413 (+),score=72.92 TRINITY_DN5122_c0_g1_i1:52-1290(+)